MWIRRVKAGETPGYPRFKGYAHFDSFGYKELNNGFRIDGRRLKLAAVGRIAVRWHRALAGVIKTARLKREAGRWFVCFCCEVPDPIALPATGCEVGIDLNLENLLMDSNGARIDAPKHYRHAQRALAITQSGLKRKVKIFHHILVVRLRRLFCLIFWLMTCKVQLIDRSYNSALC